MFMKDELIGTIEGTYIGGFVIHNRIEGLIEAVHYEKIIFSRNIHNKYLMYFECAELGKLVFLKNVNYDVLERGPRPFFVSTSVAQTATTWTDNNLFKTKQIHTKEKIYELIKVIFHKYKDMIIYIDEDSESWLINKFEKLTNENR